MIIADTGPINYLVLIGAAVKAARGLGFLVTGTIGVLELAADRGLVDLADVFARLLKTNFHVRRALLDDMLERRERLRDVDTKH